MAGTQAAADAGGAPADQLTANFDALAAWYTEPDFRRFLLSGLSIAVYAGARLGPTLGAAA